jgi:transposase
MEWKPMSLDQLLTDDHPARLVWAYVESLDLSELYQAIRAVEGHVGRDPIDPKILVALWLYATIDGVGSARRLDRLCKEHVAYQWLCGGVSVNYHTLSDFRVEHVEFLDRLLTQSVATLLHQGLIELNRVAQDGMRVRASAGSGSFRRRPTLEKCLEEALAHLAALKQESEQDPSAEDRRHQAAQQRAARERVEKLQQALDEVAEVGQKMERREKGSGCKARASMTDPDARRMKMGDGGFRPAYNVQFATTTDTLVIVGVDVTNAGSDGGLMTPMVNQVEERHAARPDEYLADGGFSTLKDIETLELSGTQVYAPVKDEEKKRKKGEDPFDRRKGDSDEIAAWRRRMGTEAAKEIYKQRAATAEFPNAGCRNRGLLQFPVRGQPKTKAVSLWHALAHNFQRTLSLRAAAGLQIV